MLKRTHAKPEGLETEDSSGFIMIAKSDVILAISQKLSGSQWKLWAFLMICDPFSDRTVDGEPIYRKIPSPSDIAIKIGVSRRTVEKDLVTLRDLDLYDFKITEWHGHNKAAEHAKLASELLKAKYNKGGYLTVDAAILPQDGKNNRETEILTAIAAKKNNSHNNDRERVQTYSDLDQIQLDSPSLPPSTLEEGGVNKNASLNQEQESQFKIPLPDQEEIPIISNTNELTHEDNLPAIENGSRFAAVDIDDLGEEVDSFLVGRRKHPGKGTYLSRSTDPWMESASNPVKDFALWATSNAHENKRISLPDAKAEIRNDCVRANDLWDGYQFTLAERVAVSTPAPMSESAQHMYQVTEHLKSGTSLFCVPNASDEEARLKAREHVFKSARCTSAKGSLTSLSSILTPPVSDAEYIKESMGQKLNSLNDDLKNEAFAWAKENGYKVERDRTSRLLVFIDFEF